MKKTTLILLQLFAGFAYGQPTLNSSDFNNLSNVSIQYYVLGLPTFSPGNAGENQVWDFSGLNFSQANGSNLTYSDCSTIPQSINLPDNLCKSYEGNMIDFYHLVPNKLELISKFNGISNFNYIDYETIFEFPFNYNYSFTDTYESIGTIYTNTITYDSYGTLITPYGTVNNVIRSKKQTTTNTTQITVPDSYIWFTVNPFRPILEGSIGTFQNVKFYIPQNLVTSQVDEKLNFMILPNPTNSNLQIQNHTNYEGKIKLFDMFGKLILIQNLKDTIQNININNLNNGLYLLIIENENGKIIKSEKIIKN